MRNSPCIQSFRLLFLHLSQKSIFIEKAIFLTSSPPNIFPVGVLFFFFLFCLGIFWFLFFQIACDLTLNSVGFVGISVDEYKQVFFILNASLEVTVFFLIFMYKHGFKYLLSELVDRGRFQ